VLQPQYNEVVQRADQLAKLMNDKLQENPDFCTQYSYPPTDPLPLYFEALAIRPTFNEFISSLATKSGGRFIEEELKDMGRAMENAGLKFDTTWSLEKCCDVVRGTVEFDSMIHTLVFLQLLVASDPELEEDARQQGWDAEAMRIPTKIEIKGVKNRFGKVTGGGWSDCLVNFAFRENVNTTQCGGNEYSDTDSEQSLLGFGHICEVRIVHSNMMLVRNNMGAHKQYNKFRSAMELLMALGQNEMVMQQLAEDEQAATNEGVSTVSSRNSLLVLLLKCTNEKADTCVLCFTFLVSSGECCWQGIRDPKTAQRYAATTTRVQSRACCDLHSIQFD
jgi:hypothetical protein